ncbi:MAG: protein translocase subunit SecDF [Bacteroidia bacterium]|nr:protein translocase subunit SecDF [Bacteroidia bacterium]MDW8159053.1 protein translocase subunit SecDF [Bacteroidia bacterium]
MKHSKLILVLLGIFSIICAVNLFYTFKRLSIEGELSDLTPEARTERLKDEEFFNSYKIATERSLSLGLDLQGGMYVTMRIGIDDVLIGLAGKAADSTFMKAIRIAREKSNVSQRQYVDLFVESLRELNPNARLASYFGGQSTGLSYNTPDDEIIKRLREEADQAIDRSFNIIRTRIDQFGVASPNLQKVLGTGRILIELPGVRDPERVRKLLRGTANLEFWPTYTYAEVYPYLEQIDKKLKEVGGTLSDLDAKKVAQDTVVKKDTTLAAKDTTKSTQAAQGAKEHPFFDLLKPLKEGTYTGSTPEVGYALISDTSKINAILRHDIIKAILPEDMAFYWSYKPKKGEENYTYLIAIKSNRERQAPLTGAVITDTQVGTDENNQSMVLMYMNSEGARIWKSLTSEYLGKSVAIVLDGYVYTYPVIQSVISGGNTQITGNFTIEEAKDLANILKAGKLPAPARIEGEEVVGPSLGADTVQNGLIAFILGFISVVVFMAAYYKKAGVIAGIALIFNLFALLGICSAANVVLTLPGIAGIVLTMGMAVDANVLIYERIREELEQGKGLKVAIANGFSNAFSAIIDGNITTFLVGVILFINGIGPIRGFAVTLMVGIITTLIAGLLVTRLILDYLANKSENAEISFGTATLQRYFKSLSPQIIAKRKKTYGVILSAVILFVGSIAIFGFKLGLDFQGGRQYLVELASPVSLDKANSTLYVAFNNQQPVIKTVNAEGAAQRLLITTNYLYDQQDADKKVEETLIAGLKSVNPSCNPVIIKNTTVGPSVADDIKRSALQSVIWSLVVMFLYILLRFRYWQFGVGAVMSLTFNVLTTLGIFSLLGKFDFLPFSVELDQAFIAAILTIVGYTINDTVIVFDRIRENVREDGKSMTPLDILFNRSIVETLSRTIITAGTTFLTALVLFIFAGDVLRGFMLALMLGITVGTLSSIFVAAPLTLDFMKGAREKMQEEIPPVASATATTASVEER